MHSSSYGTCKNYIVQSRPAQTIMLLYEGDTQLTTVRPFVQYFLDFFLCMYSKCVAGHLCFKLT